MDEGHRRFRANVMLLITAAIWGFGFVAQRYGAMLVPAFTFNGFRFIIGAVSLIPLLIFRYKRATPETRSVSRDNRKVLWIGGALAGVSIFLASWFQQAGMETTNPGKASFLTACYIILVPILGLLIKERVAIANWIAILLAIVGLYFLCIHGEFIVQKGDILELCGAVFWAVQILIVDKFVDRVDSISLAFVQFLVCSILCFASAASLETVEITKIGQAIIPILYGGLGSVGIAYTLQTVAQKDAIPSHAALILGSEILFGTMGGIIFFNENLGWRGYFGCLLILIGVIISITQSNSKNN